MSDRPLQQFLDEHRELSRRWFLRAGAAGVAAVSCSPLLAIEPPAHPAMREALAKLESYMTKQDDFRDVSRGKPKPHSLSNQQMAEVGLTRDTWQLEVDVDADHPAKIGKPMTKKGGTALNFERLLELAKKHAVRFPKVMTCLNIGCPLGMGIWEGVPLREVLWQTRPRQDLRRVFYYGYHNDKPEQMFRSSLPVGRILEDPFDLPPVILCYKLNGQWLTPQRGGPVRVVVPEAYGFKSIKWLTNIVLTNLATANDTYENGNNDLDSHLKSFAATLSVPRIVKPNTPFAITGYAQSGISGVSKVQVWIQRDDDTEPVGDKYFSQAPWLDAEILGPPQHWGGDLPDNRIASPTIGFDKESGQPLKWPMHLAKVHWAILHPGLPKGEHTLRSRTIDQNGHAQPMPRPFRKSGHAAIEQVEIRVEP